MRGVVLRAARLMGRFEPVTPEMRQSCKTVSVRYFGDVPADNRGLAPREQHRQDFILDRPSVEIAKDILYSPAGMAWREKTLIEKYSFRPPSVKQLFERPQKKRTLEEACIVESTVNFTYGDWVHCVLGTILRNAPLPSPLSLPKVIADKPYVRRDLKLAGIDVQITDEWTLIKKAHVLRKQTPLTYWTKDEVSAYQKTFAPDRDAPAQGSIAYFGRFDIKSEVHARAFPSAEAAEAVKRLGGSIEKQEKLTAETAAQYAGGVDTVIADHGSGVLNIMHWRTKNLIELVVDQWWVNNSLFVAAECGVENIGVIDVDGLNSDQIEEKLRACLEYFAGGAG
ncbi:MAG: hypothetical protein AAGD92_02400 [Pseudomonadota bacterium]